MLVRTVETIQGTVVVVAIVDTVVQVTAVTLPCAASD